MENKLVLTYSLLAHLKETSPNPTGSLIDIFVPIVKKGLSDYATERSLTEIKGKAISEIQKKILEIFGLEIPIPVLNVILGQIEKELNDKTIFCLYSDGSFIIKSFNFTELEGQIDEEKKNLFNLQKDFRKYCNSLKTKYDFEELNSFVLAQNIDLFSGKKSEFLNVSYHIPNYIQIKLKDEKILKTLSNIYLGGIISSYLTLKITKKVTNTELLIDTNFFISLIDLNTEDSNNICNQLFNLCKDLGFRFTILFSTLEQIRILLSSRIQDFANKELIGSIRCADIFSACIRRNLDKTQLERIKDTIPRKLNDFGIVVIQEAQIKDVIERTLKSKIYKELKEIRGNEISALNDAIAEFYVMKKRGKNILEFSDANCWFLHNSFNTYYYNHSSKIHERNSISANELLVLLWLSNPSQLDYKSTCRLAKGGLSLYVTKYRRAKMPAIDVIRAIRNRADKALEYGVIEEKDIYNISVRMSEGHLQKEDAIELARMGEKDFVKKISDYSEEDTVEYNDLLDQISNKDDTIEKQSANIEGLGVKVKILEDSIFKKEKSDYVQRKYRFYLRKSIVNTTLYFFFILLVTGAWILDSNQVIKLGGAYIVGTAFILVILFPILLSLINHQKILGYLKFCFSKISRNIFIEELGVNFDKAHESI